MTKTFIHRFADGQTIRLDFDLSAAKPYWRSNLAMDKQPVAILEEYRRWQNAVIMPELPKVFTPDQMLAMVMLAVDWKK